MKCNHKPVAFALACVLAASVFTGCGSTKAPTGPDAEEYLVDSGNKYTKVEGVASIDGVTVTLSEFKLNFLPQVIQIEQMYGAEAIQENPEFITMLKENTLSAIQAQRVYDKYVKESGIALTEDAAQAKIDAQVAADKANYTTEAEFASELYAGTGLDEAHYRMMLKSQLSLSLLQEEISKPDSAFVASLSDEAAKAQFAEQYLRAKHILIQPQSEADTDEVLRARAGEALARAKAGESFDALIAEYGTDPGMASSPDGYYFTDGEMVDEFYQGTLALAENEISDLVPSQFGYHIIQRLPLDPAYFDANKAELIPMLSFLKVNAELQALIAASKIEKTPEFDLITLENCVWNTIEAPAPLEPSASAAPEASAPAASAEAPASSSSAPAESAAPAGDTAVGEPAESSAAQ